MAHSAHRPETDRAGDPRVPDPSPIDWGTVLEDIGGDEGLLRELVETFVVTYPETVEEIRQALHHDDLRTVSRAAHKLKGAVSNFGFGPAYDAARNLEEMAVAGRLAATRVTVKVVEQEFASLAERLRAHFRAPAP